MKREALALALAVLPALGVGHPRRSAERRPLMPGDVLQALLEAQDRRYWTQAEVVKTEVRLGSKPGKAAVTRGSLTASGRKARLTITSPARGLVVADGRYLWVELPQVRQVYRYDQRSLAASGNFFLDLASSIRHYEKDSVKRRFRPGPGYRAPRVSAMELVPRRGARSGFERLRLWVDTRRWIVLRVQLDAGGTRSDIRFERVHVMSWRGFHADPGQALPGDLFHYRRPKGFEVFTLDL